MKGLIVNGIAGVGLFAGALVGGLMATGRWNHEGVANIPVLNMMFPAPPAADATDGHAAEDPHAAPTEGAHDAGSTTNAHDAAADAHGAPVDGAAQQEPQDPKRLPLPKPGKSLFQKEEKKGGGGHGEAADAHGAEGGKEAHGKDAHGSDAGHKPDATHGQSPAPGGETAHSSAPERDFTHLQRQLKQEPGVRYEPGALFRFEGLPSGVTPDQLNSAWKRVQDGLLELERQKKALEIQDKELREFSEDVARRQTEVGKQRAEVEAMHRRLDERIEQFQDQIKLIRNDEVAGLKRNAQHLATFEPKKAVEIITDQWKTDAGQVEVLKLLEFMSKDDIDEIYAEMPTALVRDVMQKRLKVTKEPTPPANSKK